MRNRLSIPRAEVETRIQKLVDEAEVLLKGSPNPSDSAELEQWTHDLERWHGRGRAALATSFEGTTEADDFFEAATGHIWRSVNQSDRETIVHRGEATKRGVNTLRALLEQLDYSVEPESPAAQTLSVERRDLPLGTSPKVFVVHGRDDRYAVEIARKLERLGLTAVILAEQANEGKTLIEKFEAHAQDVAYAVVVLVAEDRGAGPGEAVSATPNRARQNVILELGFFMGSLGRARVAALYESGVELPSDIHGFVWIPIDPAWPYKLARELLNAGFSVDVTQI